MGDRPGGQDIDLVMDHRRGSPPERFEALFRAHHRDVHRFVLRRADAAIAEDVANEAFATCWRRFDEVPEGRELSWLYTAARHELANRRRASSRAQDKERRHAAGAVAAGRDPAEALSERDAVVRAFLSLSDGDQEVLRLIAWDDLPVEEAARVLGVRRPVLAMRLHRARRRLAARLEAEEADAVGATVHRLPSPAPDTHASVTELRAHRPALTAQETSR